MALQISFATYRLKFIHPFGTAHGVRDGTDSVFVRLERNGHTGFGEATLPPYVSETQDTVIQQLRSVDLDQLELGEFQIDAMEYPAARAALTTAFYALISKEKGLPILNLLDDRSLKEATSIALITIGLGPIDEIASNLNELPMFNGLKVKLNSTDDERRLKMILKHDKRPVLIDANQSWTSVDHALRIIELVGDRALGIEQPFPVDRMDLQGSLIEQVKVPVYGDESIKGLEDLKEFGSMFSGVNIKLMKCGGLDIAVQLVSEARRLGLKVMLGSMSESSLGCCALFNLAPFADLVDLDGPWLISNDPFQGLALGGDGELQHSEAFQERSPSLLTWTPIGA